MKKVIQTELAPKAIGPYSQAVDVGNTVYCSGQIALDPTTMTLVSDDIAAQAIQVLTNLQTVITAAGGRLEDVVKLTIYLTDLADFAVVNNVMTQFFNPPYPARTTVAVAALPKEAKLEIDAIMVKR
ncbi:MAG: reactive intermediate/imine deaminase [Gammaproteobacteria bacterium RIFCSPHIGHO2_12_FULL_43_28]|nr:MAG: reactive intermediate/imine deaminase [Gammaproteobacteria bacterium RIFCSPHIGHO2_12_FULL_43_28]